MKGKSLIGVILAAICVTVTYLLPGSEELSHEGITALGVLGMASILWISNTLPFGVTGLLALVMLVLLGVSDMASVFVGFSNSSVIFVITVFCLTAAVMNTKLTLRLINKLLRWAGSSAEKLVLAYMAAAALLSSVMSNVPVTVLFLGLAQPVLKAVGAKPGSSRLGKCLMIGIPFAAVNGGMATPAGSSFNVLAMGVFESIAGKPLTFLQWMAVGLPTAIVATLVCWICLVKIFKPEAINEECSASIREEAENAGKISAYEKKVLFMLVAMPVLWILGTWFPALDVTVVSIIGFVVMFMPGINILTWKQFEESVPWNIILMFGAILSLGTIVAKTGGAAYLSKLFLASGVMNLNIILVFFIVGVFAYLLQTFFPVAPAIISLFVPAVAAVCVPMGISAAVPTLIITIPEQYGGTEVDILTQCMVVEQACALGFPNLCWMNFACEVDDMLAFGSPEQQAETMKNAMTGTKPFSLGFTEPNAGSDNSAMSTRAEHRDGKVYINGQKTFITYADRVPYMLLMARNYENEIPQKDMSMYWLPMNTPGVKVTPLDKIGQHMINSCEVYLENVVLDESALVGKKGRGFFQLMKNFEVERLMSTAMNVGMAQAAYEEAARYATERVQFGKTIGSFQLTQEKIINMAIKIENMRNMVYHYAWMKQNGMSIATESAMAKYYTSRAAFEVVDDAMQIMGGIGYTNDVRIARLWRDCRLSRIMAGTDEIMVHIAGRALLKEFANK